MAPISKDTPRAPGDMFIYRRASSLFMFQYRKTIGVFNSYSSQQYTLGLGPHRPIDSRNPCLQSHGGAEIKTQDWIFNELALFKELKVSISGVQGIEGPHRMKLLLFPTALRMPPLAIDKTCFGSLLEI